jgi:hypothetical protein
VADNLSCEREMTTVMVHIVIDMLVASGPRPRTVFIITFSGTDTSLSTLTNWYVCVTVARLLRGCYFTFRQERMQF